MMIYPKISLIGSATGWGAKVRDTEKGPAALQAYGVEVDLASKGLPIAWGPLVQPTKMASQLGFPPGPLTLPYVVSQAKALGQAVEAALLSDTFPIVIGGDHAASIGTWSAVATAKKAVQNIGLIWIDAHMDSHTPKTSPSLAYHGMPLAALMGYGEPDLVNLSFIGAKINPAHVVVLGARSYEEGELALLKKLGVRIYFMEEVRERGFGTIFEEALKRVSQDTAAYGISLDLDVFDPEYAPGVGSPCSGGLSTEEVLPALAYISQVPGCAAFEIVEYNPKKDIDNKTAHLVKDLLAALLLPVAVSCP